MSNDSWLIPLAVFAVALTVALLVNAVVIKRRPSRDSGDLWTRVLVWTMGLLGLIALYGWLLKALEADWWFKRYHAFFDEVSLTDALASALLAWLDALWPAWGALFDWLEGLHWWALAIPFLVWLSILGIALALRAPEHAPGERRPGGWLAGSAGFDPSRRWVLYAFVPPLALLLLWTNGYIGLGTGPGFYPAALWGTLAVAVVTLIAIAYSRGRRPSATRTPSPAEAKAVPKDWVQAMQERGFKVQHLYRIEPTSGASTPQPEPQDPEAHALLQRWPLLRERHVAPELVEAMADLFATGSAQRRHGLDRLVLAADDCGQLETLGIAIQLTQLRLELVTLVVVPRDAPVMAARLAPWVPAPRLIHEITPRMQIDNSALVWVVDAGTLSERLVELSDNPVLLSRIGLVVWWDLDAYSGVMAANFWAVSHRLHRVVRRKGHGAVRSLTFARYHQSFEAGQTKYTAQLLPYAYAADDRVVVEPRRRHPVEIHLLEPTGRLKPDDEVMQARWDPTLIAARTSVEAGWPTRYEPPAALDLIKAGDFLQQRLDGQRLSRRLLPGPADAGARIMELAAHQALSIGNLLSQGGRAIGEPAVHHVGLFLPPDNPYLRHLLRLLGEDSETYFGLPRLLVRGQPQPAIVRRHLLLALREMEAVAKGLLNTFQWKADILNPVLDRLTFDQQVQRRDVRFLDANNLLRVDIGYKTSVAEYRPGPLDTVGEALVAMIDPQAGEDAEVLFRLDPERATIAGYPGRVFRHGGRTYRVDHWQVAHAKELLHRPTLTCTPIDDPVLTWRVSEPRLRRAEEIPGVRQSFDEALNQLVIEARYEEEIAGLVEARVGVPGGELRVTPIDWGDPIDSLAFPTKGLMLRCLAEDVEDYPAGLHTIAQCLAQVLAVHVGVEDDAMRVIAAEELKVGRRREWGLVILDLYPHGIGLVDVLNDDLTLLRRMLEHTRDWLARCPCQADAGCVLCVQSPAAIAATRCSVDRKLSRSEAVAVLDRLLGEPDKR
jgi:hypothetical protein